MELLTFMRQHLLEWPKEVRNWTLSLFYLIKWNYVSIQKWQNALVNFISICVVHHDLPWGTPQQWQGKIPLQPPSILAHQALERLQVHEKVVESSNWWRKAGMQKVKKSIHISPPLLYFFSFEAWRSRIICLCLTQWFMNDITIWLSHTKTSLTHWFPFAAHFSFSVPWCPRVDKFSCGMNGLLLPVMKMTEVTK